MANSLRRRLFSPSHGVIFGDGRGLVKDGQGREFLVSFQITRSHPKGVYMDASGKRWDLRGAESGIPEMASPVVEPAVTPAEMVKSVLFTKKPVAKKVAKRTATKASTKAKAANRRIAAKVGRVRKPTATAKKATAKKATAKKVASRKA